MSTVRPIKPERTAVATNDREVIVRMIGGPAAGRYMRVTRGTQFVNIPTDSGASMYVYRVYEIHGRCYGHSAEGNDAKPLLDEMWHGYEALCSIDLLLRPLLEVTKWRKL